MTPILALLLLSPASLAHAAEANGSLWKEYYLYTVGGQAAGYYEENAERRPGEKQLAVTQRWVELDGGRTETYIGAVAADDGKFTPVAFYSERKGPTRSYKIDGRVKGTDLTMTFRSTLPPGAAQKAATPLKAGTILSNFTPLFLSKQDPAKGAVKFSAVVEDARDGKFEVRGGSATLFAVKKEIKGHSCRKASVTFDGITGEWWVANDGRLCEFSIPESQAKLTLTTEAEAKRAVEK